jgi:acrylyl-CoA reductase (NADPH)
MCPLPLRQQAWARLGRELDPAKLDAMTRVVPLAGAFDVARDILAGQVRGRVVVDVNA